jgi:protein TonB
VSPHYPLEALRHSVTGNVEMDFTVTAAGDVADVKVTSSKPFGVFDRASVEALSNSRYEPAQRDGAPVAQRAHIRMRFEP